MKTPSKPRLIAAAIQRRADSAGARQADDHDARRVVHVGAPGQVDPGSEMLLVENTRIRGTKVPAVACGFSGASVVMAVRTSATSRGPRRRARSPRPARRRGRCGRPCRTRRDVVLGARIGRPDLDGLADLNRVHRLLGLEQGAGAGAAAGVDDLCALDDGKVGVAERRGQGGHRTGLLWLWMRGGSVDEAVRRRGHLRDEPCSGDDLGAGTRRPRCRGSWRTASRRGARHRVPGSRRGASPAAETPPPRPRWPHRCGRAAPHRPAGP